MCRFSRGGGSQYHQKVLQVGNWHSLAALSNSSAVIVHLLDA